LSEIIINVLRIKRNTGRCLSVATFCGARATFRCLFIRLEASRGIGRSESAQQ